jgi:hypothetical protein
VHLNFVALCLCRWIVTLSIMCLAVANEQLEMPPKWLSRAEYVLNSYCRNWSVFASSHVVSALAPHRIVSSSLAEMSLVELWFLHDILEQGHTVSEEEADEFTGGQSVMLWRTPMYTRHGRV